MARLMTAAMTKRHPKWAKFLEELERPNGCNFQERVPGDINSATWDCSGLDDLAHTRRLLAEMGMGEDAIQASIRYFEAHSGYCDCEVLFSVA
jgi:hypothetical protein